MFEYFSQSIDIRKYVLYNSSIKQNSCSQQMFALLEQKRKEESSMNTSSERRSERRIRMNRIKRRRELRTHFLTLALTFVLVITCSMMFFTVKTKAQNSDEVIYYKYYKSITVSRGDSLWTYASEYADENHYDSYQNYIDEVLQMNRLSSEDITAGQHLVIPYYSAEFVG